MNLEKHYPCVADLEARARRRIPRFMRDYLTNGLGAGVSLRRNRDALDRIVLMPRYLSDAGNPDMSCRLLGREHDAPFGVAPLGLSGLVWPKSEVILAAAARAHNVPYVLSSHANATPERIRAAGGDNGWFQLYAPKDPAIVKSMLDRCQAAGYETLVVTVDVPVEPRREHDLRNGLSVPPRFDLKTVWQMVTHPPWALRMLLAGVPQFVTLEPYARSGKSFGVLRSIKDSVEFNAQHLGGPITAERFEKIRAAWSGQVVVKGILDPEDAQGYLALGADGLIVSNHGGRQLDAAPSAVTALPRIRKAVGPDVTLIADGGVRSGLDIARMLSIGADFVLLGRAFLYAVAALDRRGADHVMNVLKTELHTAMGQLGCRTVKELPGVLFSTSNGRAD